jgi:hypothetical protein
MGAMTLRNVEIGCSEKSAIPILHKDG